jgi:hypothetical protein
MSQAKRRQRPDPTDEELIDQISRLPRQLGVWRAGQLGLYPLLLGSSLRRFVDIAQAEDAVGDIAGIGPVEEWRHATSTLIEWHSQWAQDGSAEPLPQDVVAAVNRARDWRVLETILHGLGSGDMHIAESNKWDIRISNNRDPAVEVLDMILQQVSIPATNNLGGPSVEAVHNWFTDHADQPAEAHRLPKWVQAVMYRRAVADLVNRDLSMPLDTDLGGLTLAEARQCYALLLSRTNLAALCTNVLGCRETAVWYSRPQQLRHFFSDYVDAESAEAFIRLCTYTPGRSPTSAPLITDRSFIAIPGALVSPVGFERALLRAASADPSQAGRLGNALGRRAGRWADRLRSIPDTLVAERVPVRDHANRAISDIDIAAFDQQNDLILALEAKWPVDAHTLRESGKIDDVIQSGRRQLLRIKAALDDGATIQWPPEWKVKPTTSIRWWVGTAQQLSSRPGPEAKEIKTTSLRLVEQLLPAASVSDLLKRLEYFPLPRLGIEYGFTDETVRIGRYRITVPAIVILGEPPIPPEGRRTNMGWT